ncbi:MAG: tRNA pseudouridine(55) synthase TruB, partial [Myxococcota bacterium]|nr:tRNA pseudouridine(55) synthase TruB [Myxococcota bacterium]
MPTPNPAGFMVIDKPAGLTSHDVVSVVRALTMTRRVGHTGTLDPFATGVLPIALGGATRLIQFLDESQKVYVATVELGMSTETGDATGPVRAEAPVPTLDRARVAAVLEAFTGPLMQKPHAYSAVKVAGRRLYEYARAGESVDVPARPITVHGWEILELGASRLRLRVRCGRGTYVRVLAEELAVALGTCGHLSALRREQSGPFHLGTAVDMPALARIAADREDWRPVLRPERGAARVEWKDRALVAEAVCARLMPPLDGFAGRVRVELDANQLPRIRNGGRPPPPPPALPDGDPHLRVHRG